jgi:hypothetical protein
VAGARGRRSNDRVRPARCRLNACINLTWADSAYLFTLTRPTVAPEDLARWAVNNLPATPLRILS